MQLALTPRLTNALRRLAAKQNESLAEIGIIAKSTPTGCGLALLESAILAKDPLAFDQPKQAEETAPDSNEPDRSDSADDNEP